ncbi:MAG: haloacid dehalogenase-like hydrolase [Alphaproteobacteria bacterium]|nr:MAG: haloacid dehalogenase-like hydrolase [Alphaproteobacteria bacterium]
MHTIVQQKTIGEAIVAHMLDTKIFDNPKIPWCIDLDGTLITEDVTVRAFWGLVRQPSPLKLMRGLLCFFRGHAQAKQYVEQSYKVDVRTLTYNKGLLNLIKRHRAQGGLTVLATAADKSVAERISQYLGLFDAVVASDGTTNRRAQAKAIALNERLGKGRYLYAGNSKDDLQVWPSACAALVVNASTLVAKKALQLGIPCRIL